MSHPFTATAQLALLFASGWSNGTVCDELEAVPLLVGILAAPESDASSRLARYGIDLQAVRQKWPNLVELNTATIKSFQQIVFSKDVEASLQKACERLAQLPQQSEKEKGLAPKHILFGLAATENEVSQWLKEKGASLRSMEMDFFGSIELAEKTPSVSKEFEKKNQEKEETGERNLSSITTLRILDASANRAREALRVIEDFLRFVLDDRHLTGLCKQLRHDLTGSLERIPMRQRLAARETQADVGTTLTTSAEQVRDNAGQVLTANFARLQESLRTLEEFGKLLDADLAADCKQIRYRTYTLHRAADITRTSLEQLASARLYVLIDGRPSLEEFQRIAVALIASGVDVLQFRDKKLDDRQLLERARLLRRFIQKEHLPPEARPPLFIMNDRPDLAALARADGVHIGQDELSVKDVRSIVGPDMLVGVSTHNIEQARQAVLDGANYIGVGPTFPSGTKSFEHFPGVEFLRQVAAEIRLPAFAIGGIDRQNVAQVLATGMTRIAVGGAILDAPDPVEAARELTQLIGQAPHV